MTAGPMTDLNPTQDRLVLFVMVQLDEEERAAKRCALTDGSGRPPAWRIEDYLGDDGYQRFAVVDHVGRVMEGISRREIAEHIVRHDPVDVLADVMAKREIVTHFAEWIAVDGGRRVYTDAICSFMAKQLLRHVLAIARAYAGRPGFDDRWR